MQNYVFTIYFIVMYIYIEFAVCLFCMLSFQAIRSFIQCFDFMGIGSVYLQCVCSSGLYVFVGFICNFEYYIILANIHNQTCVRVNNYSTVLDDIPS